MQFSKATLLRDQRRRGIGQVGFGVHRGNQSVPKREDMPTAQAHVGFVRCALEDCFAPRPQPSSIELLILKRQRHLLFLQGGKVARLDRGFADARRRLHAGGACNHDGVASELLERQVGTTHAHPVHEVVVGMDR